jgi:metallophosphoesterase (TIGR00282 family)
MKILYIGDIMGPAGRATVKKVLPEIKREFDVDFVLAQAENMGDDGKGFTPADVKEMQTAGIDFFTGGNWSTRNEAIHPALNDPSQPVIRPANYPEGTPGLGHKVVKTPFGDILVISLLGQIVPHSPELNNPLTVIDELLEQYTHTKRIATIVNYHGDYSSEKLVIGYYLDGRVTFVGGDHWHIPTADALVLPGGTAHITDVGMVGSRDSSLGVKLDTIIKRWQTNKPSRNELETDGVMQFNAVVIDVDTATSKARSIHQILRMV